MRFQPRLAPSLIVMAGLLMFSAASASSDQDENSHDTQAMVLHFGSVSYLHRWSKDGQNEFTPQGEDNLATWHDMVTVNVHETVASGDQLAQLANGVLSNYQSHGKILRTDSTPRTQGQQAQHFIAAVLGDSGFLEAAFARVVLIDGVGVIVVYSHRIYGKQAGPPMSEWLKAKGPQVEKTLMAWDQVPALSALKSLPQSK